MVIKTKVTFKEYAKLLFTLAYSKPLMIILVCMALLNGSWILCYYLDIMDVPEPMMVQYFGFILIAVVQPLGLLFMIWRNYATSIHLRETLELHFSNDIIKMKAKGFLLESLWSKMYRIIELKYWFVIYQNNLSAIIIPKKAFQQDEMEDFKRILLAVKDTTVVLKN